MPHAIFLKKHNTKNMHKNILFPLLLLLACSAGAQTYTQTLKGRVLDKGVKTPLIGATVMRGGVESDLTARSLAALKAAGLDGAAVTFDGRDGRISLPPGMDAAKALSVVAGVDGVRVADIGGGSIAAPASSPSIAAPAASPTVVVPTVVPFGLSRTAAGIVLTGSVPDEATRSALVAAVKAAAPGVTVTDQLTVTASAPATGLPTAATLGALVAALPDGAAAAYQNGTITLTGQVASEAAKAAAGAAAAAAFPSAKVANGLTVSAPVVAAECARLVIRKLWLVGRQKSDFLARWFETLR